MGQGQSTPVQTQVEVKPPQPNVVDTSSAPVVEVKPTPVATETSKCPVSASAKMDEQSKLSALCPIKKETKPADATTVAAPTEAAKSPAEPECPVVYKNPNVYNVSESLLFICPSYDVLRRFTTRKLILRIRCLPKLTKFLPLVNL